MEGLLNVVIHLKQKCPILGSVIITLWLLKAGERVIKEEQQSGPVEIYLELIFTDCGLLK